MGGSVLAWLSPTTRQLDCRGGSPSSSKTGWPPDFSKGRPLWVVAVWGGGPGWVFIGIPPLSPPPAWLPPPSCAWQHLGVLSRTPKRIAYYCQAWFEWPPLREIQASRGKPGARKIRTTPPLPWPSSFPTCRWGAGSSPLLKLGTKGLGTQEGM